MSATFEHISIFEKANEGAQLRAIVDYILETRFIEEGKLGWRIQKYANKKGISYPQAAEIVRDNVRSVIEARLEKI